MFQNKAEIIGKLMYLVNDLNCSGYYQKLNVVSFTHLNKDM